VARGAEPRLDGPGRERRPACEERSERGLLEWAYFSAQQAAEKVVKAIFQAMSAEAWGYAVADLLMELGRRHAAPEALVEGGLELARPTSPPDLPTPNPSGSRGRGIPKARPFG
jgi:HEPN domain-containing protein